MRETDQPLMSVTRGSAAAVPTFGRFLFVAIVRPSIGW
jgi:hypothetical protein